MQTPSASPVMVNVRPSLAGRGALVLAILIAFTVVSVLTLSSAAMAHWSPGYDFRYFWVAGRVWIEGVNPYGPDLPRLSAEMIPEGHVPTIWPYPPTLWLPTVLPALFPFEIAWKLWLGLYVLTMILTSGIVAAGLPALRLPVGAGRALTVPRPLFFALHLGLMASGEASLLGFTSGQVTGLIYLGAALMLVGIHRGRDWAAIAGLTILFMKPHIGAAIAVGLLISGARGRRLVLWAVVASVVLMLPALAIAPTAVFDWLQGLARYDGVNTANIPAAMTGVQNLIWHSSGAEIGSFAASLICLAVAAALAVWLRRGAVIAENARLAHLAAAMILIALAAAPLHIYDFILFGAVLPLIALPTGARVVAATLALIMLFWPSALYLKLGEVQPTQIFVGSTFATMGAAILLMVLLSAAPVAGLRRLAPL